MKKYTKHSQRRFDQVKPETLNANLAETLNTYNGHLDSQNMPVNSVNNDKLVVPTESRITQGESSLWEWKGQTQDYHQIRFLSGDEGGINDWLADKQIVLQTDPWTSGWNNLSEYIDGFYINFTGVSGILYGHFQVNHFYGCQTYEATSGASNVWGQDWWIRWGLFLNDNLIAETGNCYPRAEANVVPFKVPIGSQDIKLDLRFMVITSNPLLTGMADATEDITGYVEIFGANIWACNQKK